MFDYSFLALLFSLATTLAPADSVEVSFQNVRHPDQRMHWVREDDGRWAMTMNGREVGHFERDGAVIVHHTGQGAPDRFPLGELLDTRDLRRDAVRVRLSERFQRAVLDLDRSDNQILLTEPARRVLVTRLRLEHVTRTRRR